MLTIVSILFDKTQWLLLFVSSDTCILNLHFNVATDNEVAKTEEMNIGLLEGTASSQGRPLHLNKGVSSCLMLSITIL